MTAPENPVARLIKNFLSSSSTEAAVRRQIFDLAGQNLHVPEVVQALVDSLEHIKDAETRRELLRYLCNLQPVRFPDLSSFLNKLIALLEEEKERAFRLQLIRRLIAGLLHEPGIAKRLLDLVTRPGLNDEEAALLCEGLAKINTLPLHVLESLIIDHHKSSIIVQRRLLGLLKETPTLSESMTQGLIGWLSPAVATEIRNAVLQLLSRARKLDASLNPLLSTYLRSESKDQDRLLYLNLLKKTLPWDATTYRQVLAVAHTDNSADMRAAAHELLKDQPEPAVENPRTWIELYFTEAQPRVRMLLWERVKRSMRDEAFRNELVAKLTQTSEQGLENLHGLEEQEFREIVSSLLPYFRRQAAIKSLLMQLCASAMAANRRKMLAHKLLPLLDLEQDLDWIAARFKSEDSQEVKAQFFSRLQPLSVHRFPMLVALYVDELLDPSSEFRVKSAEVLSPATEAYAEQIIPAFEDVLLFDTSVELLRPCLQGYLLPSTNAQFEVLMTIIRNDNLELSLRKQALQKCEQDPGLSPEQSRELAQTLAVIPHLSPSI